MSEPQNSFRDFVNRITRNSKDKTLESIEEESLEIPQMIDENPQRKFDENSQKTCEENPSSENGDYERVIEAVDLEVGIVVDGTFSVENKMKENMNEIIPGA